MLDPASSGLPRHLGLAGTYNLRDTGGYRTLDGRTTRWRTFLRSDSQHRVPPMARSTLLRNWSKIRSRFHANSGTAR
jgi:Tyrosine phosphatase family